MFGCITDKVYIEIEDQDRCGYNDSSACSFAVAIGVIAFLLCLVFLVKDVLYVIVDFSQALKVSK